MFWCFSLLPVQRAKWISDKHGLHPALCPEFPVSLGHAEQYTPAAFVSWFLEDSILQRAAHSASDAQAQQQLQPTCKEGGINSLQEERQEITWYGAMARAAACKFSLVLNLSCILISIRVILDIASFPHLVKFKRSEPFAAFAVVANSDCEF